MNRLVTIKDLDRAFLRRITDTLKTEDRVLFAYLYGSACREGRYRDLDIAVYTREGVDPFVLSSDLKIKLHKVTGLPPDTFDIRVVNQALHSDIMTLLYLKSVLTESILLIDKSPEARSDFIEAYGLRYRECEGLLEELLA